MEVKYIKCKLDPTYKLCHTGKTLPHSIKGPCMIFKYIFNKFYRYLKLRTFNCLFTLLCKFLITFISYCNIYATHFFTELIFLFLLLLHLFFNKLTVHDPSVALLIGKLIEWQYRCDHFHSIHDSGNMFLYILHKLRVVGMHNCAHINIQIYLYKLFKPYQKIELKWIVSLS